MTLFIDEVYLKDNYPIPFTVDAFRLRAVINLSQKTYMRDMLGDPLYKAFSEYLETGTSIIDFSDIEDDIKMLQCLYVAKGLFINYYDNDDQTRELNISYIDGNIKLYEKMISSKIEASESLSTVVSEESSNDSNTDSSFYNSIYYPN